MRWEAIAMWPELPSIEIRPPSAAQLAEPGRHPFGRAPLPAQEFSWIPTLGNSVHKSCSSLHVLEPGKTVVTCRHTVRTCTNYKPVNVQLGREACVWLELL